MKIVLKSDAGLSKKVKVGFSWTTFFFGFIPALFRGDLKWAIIVLILEAVFGAFTFGIGAWIVGVVFSFVYNKVYIKELIEKGYKPADDKAREVLQQRQILTA